MWQASGMRAMKWALAGLGLAGLAACEDLQPTAQDDAPPAGPENSLDPELVENGRAIVEAQCVDCHAIGEAGESPRSDAPPLRTVLAGYDPDALADSFREGIHVGHPDMPDFDLGPKGVDALLAYLRSIRSDE